MKTTAASLIAYGLPSLPQAMLGLPLYVYLPVFYAQDLGLGLAATGIALVLSRLLDMLTDPLVGLLSDHWPLGRYRRKAPMILGAPLLLLGIYSLFQPPETAGMIWLVGFLSLTFFGWTLINVPYYAWGSELESGYHRRTTVATSREAFAVIGTLLALALPTLYGVADDQAAALALLGQTVLVALPLSLLLALWLVPEVRIAHPSRPSGSRWRDSFHGLTSQPAVRRLLLAFLVNGIANALPAALFLLFVQHVLQRPDLSGGFLLCYFVAAIVALPGWLALSRRIGKQASWIVSMLSASAGFLLVLLLDPGNVWLYWLVCFWTGMSLGADLAIPASMQADVVDADATQRGQHRGAVLFGFWGMAGKLALALGSGLGFVLLDLGGFNSSDTATPSLLALTLIYAILPVSLKIIVIIMLWRRPILALSDTRETTHENHITDSAQRPGITAAGGVRYRET